MQAQDIYLVAYGIVAYGEPVGSCMPPDIEVAVDQAGGYVDFYRLFINGFLLCSATGI